MARLILSMDGLVLKEIPLTMERLTIGRRPSNDIQIDNLAISGEHAAITTILDDSFLEDLNSTNGTLVNGQPVQRHALKNGDVIELGKYKLKFVAEERVVFTDNGPVLRAAGLPSYPEPERTFADTQIMIARPHVAVTQPAPKATVRLLNGPNAGKVLDLVKPVTTLGKPGVQVAVISRRPEGVYVTHVEGSKFPTVNDTALDGEAFLLEDKDVVEIAGVRMEISIRP